MIPIAVVAHPKREKMAHDLARKVNADVICWDVTRAGAEANHLQAWRWLAELPTEWGVVLEDDVIVCEDFTDQLTQALRVAPTSIVSLYLGRGRPPHWAESVAKVVASDVSWLTAPALLSAQGYAMRTSFFAQHRLVAGRVERNGYPIDEAITSWISHVRNPLCDVSYALPSLVDHRDGPTIVEHWDGPRNGLTALVADDCDPSGANLPEIRKAWRFGAHNNWDSTSIALDIPLTTKGTDHGTTSGVMRV